MNRTFAIAALLAVLLSLSGCGGGEGSGSPQPPGGGNNPPPPLDTTPDDFAFDPAGIIEGHAGQHVFLSAKVTGFEGELTGKVSDRACTRSTPGVCPFVELSRNGEGGGGDSVTLAAGDTLDVHMVVNSDAVIGETFEATVTVGEGEGAKSASIKVTVPDREPPALAVHFPPAKSITQAARIHVRGTVADDGVIKSVKVGDVAAELDSTAGTWRAEVDLVSGSNIITVIATDEAGKTGKRSISMDTTSTTAGSGEPVPSSIQASEVSPDGLSVFYGGADHTVYKLDLETGQRTVLSREPDAGSGPAIGFLRGMTIGRSDGELLVANHEQVVAVDMTNGDRTSLSNDRGKGSGPVFNAMDVTTDSSSGTVYVASGESDNKVYSIALPSGDRTIVSDATTGTGPVIGDIESITIDESTGNLFVSGEASLDNYVVFKIDPATGNRSVASAGAGPVLGSLPEARYWEEEGVVLVADAHNAALIKMDPATGDRSVVSGPTVGQGTGLYSLNSFALHAPSRVAFVVSDEEGIYRIYAVDLESGDRVVVAAD
ncbi:MAG TPA: hypothetical protein VF267_05055 [Gammaproteobacteria bacterium]